MQRLVNAKRATRDIFNDSETLLRSADGLEEGYDREDAGRQANHLALAGVALLAFVFAHRLLRETVHYVWHLEGRDHPVPPLWRIPIIFVPVDSRR